MVIHNVLVAFFERILADFDSRANLLQQRLWVLWVRFQLLSDHEDSNASQCGRLLSLLDRERDEVLCHLYRRLLDKLSVLSGKLDLVTGQGFFDFVLRHNAGFNLPEKRVLFQILVASVDLFGVSAQVLSQQLDADKLTSMAASDHQRKGDF